MAPEPAAHEAAQDVTSRTPLWGGRGTEYEKENFEVFHIDDLFVDPENADDHCSFPELKSLELFDCTLRICGLLSIAEKHQKTLRKLVLTRVTFAPNYSRYWCEIAGMCKNAFPDLTYLRLAKLVTFPPIRFRNTIFELQLEDGPTPENSRSELEGAMSYEWTKGDTNGTGGEFIGFRCPWAYDEDKIREKTVS